MKPLTLEHLTLDFWHDQIHDSELYLEEVTIYISSTTQLLYEDLNVEGLDFNGEHFTGSLYTVKGAPYGFDGSWIHVQEADFAPDLLEKIRMPEPIVTVRIGCGFWCFYKNPTGQPFGITNILGNVYIAARIPDKFTYWSDIAEFFKDAEDNLDYHDLREFVLDLITTEGAS